MGALTLLWVGTTDEGLTLGGKVVLSLFNVPSTRGTYASYLQYLIPWARVGTPKASAQDPKLAEELWTWMEEQVQNI
jgi:retinol dehydrogenase-12